MSAKVWLDGQWVEKLDAKVSVLDHGLLFGDGVWAGTRIYAGQAHLLTQHLERLLHNATLIGLKIPHSLAELTTLVADAIAKNNRIEGYVRIIVTRGAGMMGFDHRKCEPCIAIVADDVLVYPREVADTGLHVLIAHSVRRYTGDLASQGGTLSSLHAVLAKQEAIHGGCLDAIILDETGHFTGTTDGAFFGLLGDEFRTPHHRICPDPIMQHAVKTLAESAGYRVVEEPLLAVDLPRITEAFLASSSSGIVPIVMIDQKPVGLGAGAGAGVMGPITQRLRTLFLEQVRATPHAGC